MQIIRFATIFSLIALLALSAAAQTTTSRIEGIVEDASGGLIPGAKVTALNTKTGITTETTTTTAGIFVFAALPPGTYVVAAESQGFRKSVHTNVVLNVSETVSETFKLEIGVLTESVTVESSVQRINASDAQVGRNITMRDIDVLPQLARTPITLAVYMPGTQINVASSTDGSFSVVNGQRQGSNNSTLDGIDVNDAVAPRMGLAMTANNSDSVSEFRMVTNGGKAEYGRSAGAQIEMVTRSGGNRWTGNGFDYLRNTDLNANNFFNNSSNTTRPIFQQNLFGGSLGGPIQHDKLFIFGNYQGRRTKTTTIRNRTVLTPLAKSGIFRWKSTADSTIQQYNIVANDPRKIGIDSVVAKNLALLPDPNNSDIGDTLNTAGFRFNSPSGSFEDQLTIRGDYTITSNNRIFYRHAWQRNSSLDALNNADSTYPGQPSGTQGGHRWGIAAGDDWTINPRLVNEFRYGHQSAGVDFLRPRVQGPLVNSGLFTNPLTTAFAQGRNSPVNEYTDYITWIKGKHTFKAGGNVRLTTQWGYNYAGAWANIAVGTGNGNQPASTFGPTTGISSTDRNTFLLLYNNLLGRIQSTTLTYYSDLQQFQPAGTARIRTFKFNEQGYFFQDDWKIKPNLTFNFGLRWEFSGVPSEENGQQGTVDQAASINLWNNNSNLALQKSSQWYNNDWNNFAPRFGLAWAPGNGKTSIRAGYGIYYDRLIGATASLADGNTPGFSQAGTLFPNSAGATSDFRISDGIPISPVPAAPVLNLPNNRINSIVIFPPDLRTGYVHQFNLTIQREILRNTILELGYIGTRGIKLFMNRDVNQARVPGDFQQSFLQLQAYRNGGANNGPAVPASNTLVKMFGSVNSAISAIGGSTLDQGLLGSASDTVDVNNYKKYAAGGVSDFYLRNYPQFYEVVVGGNSGRSYYDSMQVTLRRQAGVLKMTFNYTYSKSIDNITAEGNGFTSPIDNFNIDLNKARSDNDHTHSANWQTIYTLPIGSNHLIGRNFPGWADRIFGGWDLGMLGIWQSGTVFTASSGRATYSNLVNSWANFSGDRNIGTVNRQGNGAGGVYFFTPDQINAFSYATAGNIGNSGRNAFRGPRYFDIDLSMVKRFRISEYHNVSFRAEAYDVFNNVNFANPGATFSTPSTFGRISATYGNSRILQMALRYEF